jgi:hypothetical protein
MDGICLDRLLKQRPALHKLGNPLDLPVAARRIKEFVGRRGLAFSPLIPRTAADTAVDGPRMIAATVETVK